MIFVAPKNFKRGRLIANKYTVLDLLIAIIGVLITLLLEIMFLLSGLQDTVGKNIAIATILLLPAGIGTLFIVPNGIYHNIFTFCILSIQEIKSPKTYIWKGIVSDVAKRED